MSIRPQATPATAPQGIRLSDIPDTLEVHSTLDSPLNVMGMVTLKPGRNVVDFRLFPASVRPAVFTALRRCASSPNITADLQAIKHHPVRKDPSIDKVADHPSVPVISAMQRDPNPSQIAERGLDFTDPANAPVIMGVDYAAGEEPEETAPVAPPAPLAPPAPAAPPAPPAPSDLAL